MFCPPSVLCRYYAGFCDKIEGRTLAMEDGKMGFTKYEPVGVVGAITPWNFPFMMTCLKLVQVSVDSIHYMNNCRPKLIFWKCLLIAVFMQS